MRKVFGVAALILAASSNASAEGFKAVPTGWRLESYGATGVVLWHTPSTCSNGQLMLPAGSSVADHNRLYATVMAAKTANLSMFIYYEMRENVCSIISYGLD